MFGVCMYAFHGYCYFKKLLLLKGLYKYFQVCRNAFLM